MNRNTLVDLLAIYDRASQILSRNPKWVAMQFTLSREKIWIKTYFSLSFNSGFLKAYLCPASWVCCHVVKERWCLTLFREIALNC